MLTYKYVLLSPFGFPFDTKKNHKVCREPVALTSNEKYLAPGDVLSSFVG
jgi:hypothetical protein